MGHRERGVKRLDAQCLDVFLESLGRHQRDGAEAANVAVVEVARVIEREVKRGVRCFPLRQGPGRQEQRAGEARLHDDAVARAQVEHDALRASPAAHDRGAGNTTPQRGGRHLAQHVGLSHDDAGDRAAAQLAIEIASDRLSFR